jgi:sarcosine/dimethylglycine N-methyltransferase
MTQSRPAIKTMKLYTHVERVQRELHSQGLHTGPLSTEDLVGFDQLHYGGVAVVDEAIEQLGLSQTDKVLDVGAGLGGPARHIAQAVGCEVTAVELQPDLNALGEQLTERCGLSDHIHHQRGDILTTPLPRQGFDALVSWLTVLHIPQRTDLFERCHTAIKTGGGVFIEDFVAKEPIEGEIQKTLAQEVYCHHLPSQAEYVGDLEDAGFTEIQMQDMSKPWTAFVNRRLNDFQSNSAPFIERHGQATFDALHQFYGAIVDLFSSEAIGGLRIQAVADR